MEDIISLYIVYETKFNSDKPRAKDASPSVRIATLSYEKAKDELRSVSNNYNLDKWDIEDMEEFDYFEHQNGFSYTVVGIDKLKVE